MAAPPPSSQQQHLPARCVLTGMLNAQYNHHVCRRLPQRELHEALRTDTDAKREAVALGNGRVIAVRAEVGTPPTHVTVGGDSPKTVRIWPNCALDVLGPHTAVLISGVLLRIIGFTGRCVVAHVCGRL